MVISQLGHDSPNPLIGMVWSTIPIKGLGLVRGTGDDHVCTLKLIKFMDFKVF